MRNLTYFLAFAVALFCASIAAAVDIEFDLSTGTFTPNPPAEVGLAGKYESGPIDFDPFVIPVGETRGIWVTFEDPMVPKDPNVSPHLEVIDTPSNSNGVEKLETEVSGRVIGGPNTELWVDVTLTGVTGHIREAFDDPGADHPDRPPFGTPDGGPPVDRNQPIGDVLIGDWDGANDGSGTDIWNLSHQDVVVDRENHGVVNAFVLETAADDLTDDRYVFHDIHWEITNHGPNPVEIFSVEFTQDGNIVQLGEWIPEPSSLLLAVLGALAILNLRRRNR